MGPIRPLGLIGPIRPILMLLYKLRSANAGEALSRSIGLCAP